MADVMDSASEELGGKLDPEGEYYIGAAAGDGTEPRFRGPLDAAGTVTNIAAWARSAFAGTEAQVATADEMPEPKDDEAAKPQTYTVVATITSGGPGEAFSTGGSGARKKPAAKRASSK